MYYNRDIDAKSIAFAPLSIRVSTTIQQYLDVVLKNVTPEHAEHIQFCFENICYKATQQVWFSGMTNIVSADYTLKDDRFAVVVVVDTDEGRKTYRISAIFEASSDITKIARISSKRVK